VSASIFEPWLLGFEGLVSLSKVVALIKNWTLVVKSFKEIVGLDNCYELKSLKLDKRTNSCIRVNTRELDRELFYKLVYLI